MQAHLSETAAETWLKLGSPLPFQRKETVPSCVASTVPPTGGNAPPPLTRRKLLQSQALALEPEAVCAPRPPGASPRSPGVGKDAVTATIGSAAAACVSQWMGRATGSQVAPSSREASRKKSEELAVRSLLPPVIVAIKRPREARVGLSRMRKGWPGGRPSREMLRVSLRIGPSLKKPVAVSCRVTVASHERVAQVAPPLSVYSTSTRVS